MQNLLTQPYSSNSDLYVCFRTGEFFPSQGAQILVWKLAMCFTRICLKKSQVFYLSHLLEYLSADFSSILKYPYCLEKPKQGIRGLDIKSPCCLLYPCTSINIINLLLWFTDPDSYSSLQCWVWRENWYLPSQSEQVKEASHFWHLSNEKS